MQGLIESYHGDLEAISDEVTRLRSCVSTEKEARMRMEAHYKGRESLLSQEVSSLKEQLARKDDELANTFGLASDLNRQRGT